ncbi:MAG: hypothetical protein ABJB01_05975 [Rudaea sp.]
MQNRLKLVRRCVATLCLVIATCTITACSQSSSADDAAKATAAANPLGDRYAGPPTPCDNELSVKDAADLINVPVSINHFSMTASRAGEGCELGSGSGFSAFIDISIKKADRPRYASLVQFATKAAPLPGVGDEAISEPTTDSNVPNAKELAIVARKGDWVCEASLIHKNGVAGDKVLISTNDADNAKKLGALCNKLFAAKN